MDAVEGILKMKKRVRIEDAGQVLRASCSIFSCETCSMLGLQPHLLCQFSSFRGQAAKHRVSKYTYTFQTGICSGKNKNKNKKIKMNKKTFRPYGYYKLNFFLFRVWESIMGAKEKKNTEIDRWYICLIDSNDAEKRLHADLPDDLAERIDEMIEAEYDVSWGV